MVSPVRITGVEVKNDLSCACNTGVYVHGVNKE